MKKKSDQLFFRF